MVIRKNKIETNSISPKSKYPVYSATAALLLSIAILFTSSACSVVQEPTTPIAIVHTVDGNPTPLTDAEKVLTIEGYGAKGAAADTSMSLADMLMYAIQDEYLAHGEYATIISKFGSQNPYANIILAEANHIASLKGLFTAYGLTFPEDGSAEHQLIPADLLVAARTGVQAEIDNIAMYESFLSHELSADVNTVFSSLMKASSSHLLSFEKQVDKLS